MYAAEYSESPPRISNKYRMLWSSLSLLAGWQGHEIPVRVISCYVGRVGDVGVALATARYPRQSLELQHQGNHRYFDLQVTILKSQNFKEIFMVAILFFVTTKTNLIRISRKIIF